MTCMRNYFSNKIYDQPIGDLISAVLGNGLRLEINVIEDFNARDARKKIHQARITHKSHCCKKRDLHTPIG